MRRVTVSLFAFALLCAAGCGDKGPKCKKGKPCGETCIAKDKDCVQ